MVIKFKNMLFFIYLIFYFSFANADAWRAACERDYPPYNFIQDGKAVGIDTEIVDLVMKKLGIKYTIEYESFSAMFSLLKEGKIDFAWQFVSNLERQRILYLVGPIHEGITVFLVRTSSDMLNWKRFSDFKDKKIGIVKSYIYTKEFDGYEGLQKEGFKNNDALLSALLDGSVDVAIGDLYTFAYISRQKGYSNYLRFLPTSVKKVPRYVGFSLNDKGRSQMFQKALNELIKTEAYKEIIRKYTIL